MNWSFKLGRFLGIDAFVHCTLLPIGGVARLERMPDTVEEDSPLDELMTHLRHEGGHAIPVMGQGRLTGLLTAENLIEYSVIREASRSSKQPPPLPSGSHSLS
ncbi:MAG: CBS domain-containing protein [Verrucomicrobia bacterium]|nr:CBS domain-containing protein [Verrucomicrobiota bacterium]